MLQTFDVLIQAVILIYNAIVVERDVAHDIHRGYLLKYFHSMNINGQRMY